MKGRCYGDAQGEAVVFFRKKHAEIPNHGAIFSQAKGIMLLFFPGREAASGIPGQKALQGVYVGIFISLIVAAPAVIAVGVQRLDIPGQEISKMEPVRL